MVAYQACIYYLYLELRPHLAKHNLFAAGGYVQ